MKWIKTFLFLAARRYEYLDEDSPDPEESDQPDRGPSLSPGPPAAPTSPPAAAADLLCITLSVHSQPTRRRAAEA
jgi:hypothetical protein